MKKIALALLAVTLVIVSASRIFPVDPSIVVVTIAISFMVLGKLGIGVFFASERMSHRRKMLVNTLLATFIIGIGALIVGLVYVTWTMLAIDSDLLPQTINNVKVLCVGMASGYIAVLLLWMSGTFSAPNEIERIDDSERETV